jgi:ribonuclease E
MNTESGRCPPHPLSRQGERPRAERIRSRPPVTGANWSESSQGEAADSAPGRRRDLHPAAGGPDSTAAGAGQPPGGTADSTAQPPSGARGAAGPHVAHAAAQPPNSQRPARSATPRSGRLGVRRQAGDATDNAARLAPEPGNAAASAISKPRAPAGAAPQQCRAQYGRQTAASAQHRNPVVRRQATTGGRRQPSNAAPSTVGRPRPARGAAARKCGGKPPPAAGAAAGNVPGRRSRQTATGGRRRTRRCDGQRSQQTAAGAWRQSISAAASADRRPGPGRGDKQAAGRCE